MRLENKIFAFLLCLSTLCFSQAKVCASDNVSFHLFGDHFLPENSLLPETWKTQENSPSVWWQVASDNSFTSIHPHLNVIQTTQPIISLEESLIESLNISQIYYFRYCLGDNDQWNPWSPAHSFKMEHSWTAKNLAVPSPYIRPQHVDPDVWNCLSPYFMPLDHPLKPSLDKIFGSARATLNQKSLKKAGFENTKPKKYSKVIVAKHSKLKGYLVKLFTDDQTGVNDWLSCKNRAVGALKTKNAIEELGCQNLFFVPKKWIYPLPEYPAPPEGYERKNFILVVEKARIYSKQDNLYAWEDLITSDMLDALYIILKKVGLSDSVFAFNIPFTKEGKLAFIDTEVYGRWPIKYHRLNRYLSPEMRAYWQIITHQ